MMQHRPYRLTVRVLSAIAMIAVMAAVSGCVIETPGDYRVGWWHPHHHDYR